MISRKIRRLRQKASSALKRGINERRRSAFMHSKLLAEIDAAAKSAQHSDMKLLLAESSKRVSARKAKHIKKMRRMQRLRRLVTPRSVRKKRA